MSGLIGSTAIGRAVGPRYLCFIRHPEVGARGAKYEHSNLRRVRIPDFPVEDQSAARPEYVKGSKSVDCSVP